MEKKIMAIAVIVAALMAFSIPVAMAAQQSDASDSAEEMLAEIDVSRSSSVGAFDVYVRSNVSTGLPNQELANITTQWIKFDVNAYDACKALLAVNEQLALSGSTYSINDTYNKYVVDPVWGDYYTIDESYGKITKFLNLTNSSATWQVYVYVDNAWKFVPQSGDGLGLYRPFEDYATEDFQTANIALYYTANKFSTNALPAATEYLTAIEESSIFEVSFTLINYDTAGSPEIIVEDAVGYGSDVYTALKDMCSRENLDDVAGEDNAGEFYSWVTEIAGHPNAEWPAFYPYWSFTNADTGLYSSYLMGHHSPMAGGYNLCATALLEFIVE